MPEEMDFSELDSAGNEIDAAADCATMCLALASMRRAANKICDLSGESSDACREARRKVANAAKRISKAGCNCDDSGPPIA